MPSDDQQTDGRRLTNPRYALSLLTQRLSFDDGISECGLDCDSGVLALDEGREDMYGVTGISKGQRPNTKFPCG